jgi:mannose/cellobiose epimerase-like protein (N-acyl-D-glucosamine 2-epimerase family)
VLGARIDGVKWWLFEQALPFWGRVGVDGRFGFVEHLTLDARPADVDFKRLRVQARQVYVFSHASLVGYPEGLALAENGWRFMCDHGWRESGGWVRRMGRRGGVVDEGLDLYDQAFALLATAWWVKASGDRDALWRAHRTLDAIDERLRSPGGTGWTSDDGDTSSLLQNPHMHLLEALLALDAVADDDRFGAMAGEVLDLFKSTLFDGETGTLAEHYDEKWQRITGPSGTLVEPGHHYEWVWLLHHAARANSSLSTDEADALFSFAERFGSDPETGLIYDQILDDGSVHVASHRAWPNTEALKAHLARFERRGTLDEERCGQIVDNLFRYFLDARVPGTWTDQLDAACRPAADKIPASTLYHLFLAFFEFLRVEPDIEAARVAA